MFSPGNLCDMHGFKESVYQFFGVGTGMAIETKKPADVASRVARRRGARSEAGPSPWRRETFRLPRAMARKKAREWFERFPKAAYLTEIESWRELADDEIEFVMRRLPTAD